MSVGVKIAGTNGVFFITFSCLKWLPLFEITNGYDLVYKWFDYLKNKGHFIVGYVIMPNHLHVLIALNDNGKAVHTVVSNAKRFLAYGIIDRLQKQSEIHLLLRMSRSVSVSDHNRGKLHQVFKSSFYVKPCYHEWFLLQKLIYIHRNLCKGKKVLASSSYLYPHSSAYFYHTGKQGVYPVTHYADLITCED